MAGKKEFSAVVVKCFKEFFQVFPVPDGESGQSCGGLELEGHQLVRGLISEPSYPWAVEPLRRRSRGFVAGAGAPSGPQGPTSCETSSELTTPRTEPLPECGNT